MSLVQQYERQERWRRWDVALASVPLHPGEKILDLGCGLGDVTARLQRLGADVVGVDMNDELLGAARRLHPDVRFESLDLNALDASPLCPVDGMWAGFVAAYFPRLEATLERWRKGLAPNGWIALVEMDDLFGHSPCPTRWSRELERFYEEARTAGRHDFQSGRRLAPALRAAGFDVVHESTLEDDELSFQGPATSDVLEGVAAAVGPDGRAPKLPGAVVRRLSARLHRRADIAWPPIINSCRHGGGEKGGERTMNTAPATT